MLDEEELQSLAQSIRDLGQLQPIVVDAHDRVLDGRNRLKACEIAGIAPRFTTYDGDDPDTFALSVNLRRRNLTKGQVAMVAAKACSRAERETGSTPEMTARSVSEKAGVSLGRIGQANTVLRHAPDLVDLVIAGAVSIDEAYKTARETKNQADSAESQLARLRTEDSELADGVVEGDLTLPGAWAERIERVEEEKRQRQTATRLLDELLPPLAKARGTRTFSRYDPAYASGPPITRAIIAHAMTALTEMDQVWQERDLP